MAIETAELGVRQRSPTPHSNVNCIYVTVSVTRVETKKH